jgi:hypothetical protein
LPEFPPVWINELMPNNTAGLADSKGEREPWIELVNSGNRLVSLDGWFLSDSYAAPAKWPFPPSTVIQPGQFLLVFADGQPADSTPAELHASFHLNAASGSVVLSRTQLGAPAVMDHIDYAGLGANISLASMPDGQPFNRELASQPSPGLANKAELTNHPPVIASIGNQSVSQGALLAFTVTASDPDPGQKLAFALAPPIPAGAEIDPFSGAFAWTPAGAYVGANTLTIQVTDDGVSPLSATNSFQVMVRSAVVPRLTASHSPNGTILLAWSAQSSVRYRVEYKDSLAEPLWKLLSEVTANSTACSVTDPNPLLRPERYYRLVVP